MNSSQQFQLRIGVYHHHSLKTTQLIEFLQNEANDYLANQLPQNLMIRETFIAVFDVVTDPSSVDPAEYVGFIVLYSSSSMETFLFAQSCLPPAGGEQFLLFVEMDNSERKSNEVRGQGQQFSKEKGLLFIRLTLKNPEDLVVNLQRSIYLLIENYYYPNEEERHKTATVTANYEMQISPSEFVLQYSESEQKIVASPEQKDKVMGLIEQASLLRSGREREMVAEQSAIDDSIDNVEKMLNNINRHIRKKLDSEWFTNLKQSLYKPIQKESRTYNKIKLTQHFIDDPQPPVLRPSAPRDSIYNSKYNSALQQSIKRLQSSLMKVVVVVEEEEHGRVISTRMAEIEVFQNSSFEELAANALRKLEMSTNEKNLKLMKEYIRNRVETYIRQLSRGVKNIQKQRTFERSYLAAQKK